MAKPGSAFSAAKNERAASSYSKRCSRSRPRMNSRAAAAECVEVGKVAEPRPGTVSARTNDVERSRRARRGRILLVVMALPLRQRPPYHRLAHLSQLRRTWVGSTRVARQAGSKQAAMVMIVII